MPDNELITVVKDDYYNISVNQQKNRLYITLVGYWQNPGDFSDYIDDVENAVSRLANGFTLLMDLTRYNGSAYSLNDIHIGAQKLALKAGLKKIAEVMPSNPIIKMLSEVYSKQTGASVMTFNDVHHADRWLDLY